MTIIKVGCDPEIFIKDKLLGHLVSGHDLCPGTKAEPHKVKGGAVQVDGLALEINIDPVSTRDDFINNVNTVLDELRTIVPQKRYEFVFQPAVVFPEAYFKGLPPKVKELGCNPDWNAYLRRVNDPPDRKESSMCTGAGHIHVGWLEPKDFVKPDDPDHLTVCMDLIKYLDKYVAYRCLKQNGGWDDDSDRRRLYGSAGAFRPKKYGVEHRTPSNAWLNKDEYMGKVFDWTMEGVEACINELPISEEEQQMVVEALRA